jgi:hypothetical protein
MSDRGILPPCAEDGSPAARGRRRTVRLLLSRPVGALAAAVLVLIILGCMSLSFGGLSIGCRSEPDGTLCQEGDVKLLAGQDQEIFYPIPYVSPPNLELSGDVDHCEIIEQKPDHFRIRNPKGATSCPHWRARGLRASVPPPAVFVTAPPAASSGPPTEVPPPTSTPLPPPKPLPTP